MIDSPEPVAVVVNDDLTQLTVLAGLLRKSGIQPLTFESAESALSSMNPARPPDIIITDLYMPGIDGWQFCRLLRSPEYKAFNRSPLLVISATFSDVETARITADLGANAFLPSPVDGRRFLDQVRSLINGEDPPDRLRVLIVEDSQIQADILKHNFEAHGYRADIAQTALRALTAFNRAAYDVAVLDYHLPDQEGDELLEAFRKRRSDCVCIMITTDPRPELALKWMKRGASAYLRKPLDPEYLLELCAKARREKALLRLENLLETRTRELRESEYRFRSFVENATDMVYSLSPEGVFTYISPNWVDFMGEDAEAAVGRPFSPYVHPDDAPVWRAFFERAIQTGEKQRGVEYRVRRRNGSLRWHTSSGSPLHDHKGRVVSFIGIARDVTERKKAEAKLRDSEKYYRDMFEKNRAVKLLIDPDTGRILDANSAACEFYGYAREDLTAFHIWDLNPLGERETRRRMALAFTGEKTDFEFKHRLASGEIRDVRVYSGVVATGGKRLLHSIILDITDRKRAEAERERLLMAIEQSGEVIVITDAQATILYVNPAFERTTGYSREAAVGQNPRILQSGVHDAAFYKDLWRTLSAGDTWHGRFVNRRKDGAHYTEEATISPVCDDSGRIINYVAVKRDISDHLRLDAEKARLEAQFHQAQKLESVGRLAGGVAHDLNNLLAPILGYGEMLLGEFNDHDDRKTSLEKMVQAGLKARDIVRQLLAFSRKQPLEFKRLDLNTVLARFEKLLRRTIREDVTIRLVPTRPLPLIRGDAGQLEQVIMNLAINAQDAMREGGTLRLETGVRVIEESEAAVFEGLEPGACVLLTVSDTGSGMDPATRERLFEPLFATKAKDKGTGLGLATVYGIVKQHGGDIQVESEPGRGTTLRVYLPADPTSDELPEEPPVTASVHHRGTETILLVEDESGVRNLTRTMLTRLGYTVLTAENGREALAILDRHPEPIHLLFTDVIMPGMNGRDLFTRIHENHPDIKVLYMSGYTDDVIAHHGIIEAGVHFIQKPFSMGDLGVKLREALGDTGEE